MDVRIHLPDPDRSNSSGEKMIERIARRTIYNRRWVIDLLLFFAVVLLSILLVGTRSTYNHVLELGQLNNQLLQEVKSCTDPTGVCAKRGEKITNTAINQVNQISIVAAYCANKQPTPVSAEAVRSCVQAELNK